MSDPSLSPDATQTLFWLERHPSTHHITWDELVSMLEEVATVERKDGGAQLLVHVGNERLTLTRPSGTPVADDELLALRRMLKDAGIIRP